MVVENQARATDLARGFIDALNARDAGALARLADEQIELRNPLGGRSLRGGEGLERLVLAAQDAHVQVMPVGEPDVEASDGVTVVRQPVKEIAGGRLHGTAVFEVRGDKIAAFEIDSELLRGRGRASR